jgi:hypothetical protein
VQRTVKSDVGSSLLKVLVADQKDDEPIRVADVAKDLEQIVIAQFLIDTGAGDFCFLVRLRDGSQLPKTLKAIAAKNRGALPEKIGKRAVYSLNGPHASFAQIDDRTLMLVLAMGEKKQVEETRAAAYGEREQPGPRPALRKMLSDDRADDCALRLYGHHPTKLAQSTALVLALFGVLDSDPLVAMGERIVSYRGAIKVGESADFELRITTRDADTARELLKIYDDPPREDPVVREFRRNATAEREGDDVVLKGKATRAMIERLARDPNK